MFTGKMNVIGFSILLSIVSVVITASRKYYLKKIGVHAVTLIDAVLTGTIVSLLVLLHKSPSDIIKHMSKLRPIDWVICIGTSLAIAVSIIVGRNLLMHNDLAYLDIIDGGVDLLVTALVSYFFWKEEMTLKKIGGVILVMMGLVVLH